MSQGRLVQGFVHCITGPRLAMALDRGVEDIAASVLPPMSQGRLVQGFVHRITGPRLAMALDGRVVATSARP